MRPVCWRWSSGLKLLLRDENPSVASGAVRLLWLIVGGLGTGFVIGVVTEWFERWIDDGPVELVISLITPYAAYLAAEGLHASGVISVVACGLYLSRKSVTMFSPEVRLQVTGAWTGLNFMLNGIVFVLIGLQLPYVLTGIRGYSARTLIAYGAIFSAVLIALRLVWIFPGAELAYQVRTRLLGQRYPRPPARGVFVVGWTGMRGVVALAAAISLPETLGNGEPFRQRNLIVFLTFCVILVTLVVQGLSLPSLIRALGLAGGEGDAEEERQARCTVLYAGISYLERRRVEDAGGGATHVYDDLLHRYHHRLEAVMPADREGADVSSRGGDRRLREIARGAVHAERRELIRLRDEGRIDDEVLRKLERELDLTEARQQAEVLS